MRLTNHGLFDKSTGAVVTRMGERIPLQDGNAMHAYITEHEPEMDPATGQVQQLPVHYFRDEQEIFDVLGVEYRPPHERCC